MSGGPVHQLRRPGLLLASARAALKRGKLSKAERQLVREGRREVEVQKRREDGRIGYRYARGRSARPGQETEPCTPTKTDKS